MKLKKLIAASLAVMISVCEMSSTNIAVAKEQEANNITKNNIIEEGEASYEVLFRKVDSWEGHINGEITIKNIGDTVIKDWKLEADFNGKIENIWNASMVSDDNRIVLSNAGWNRDIAVGETTSFGFIASVDKEEIRPENYELISASNEGASENEIPEEKEHKTDYIIEVKNDATYEKLCNEYGEELLETSATSNLLQEENIVCLSLNKEQAEQLEEDGNIISLEKDAVLYGSGDETIDTGAKDWNVKMIRSDEINSQESAALKDSVRIAVLDTGVALSSDIPVEEYINLIPGEEDVNPLYEDASGHGTSIASVIAAQDNDEGITGINPNASVYSVKVLDDNKRASVSRVVEGIYWCIDNNINIINMSFGTFEDSDVLHNAVIKAKNAGILMIAAAGNQGLSGNDTVEYPAAYDEVMAVGGVNAEGEKCQESAEGEEVEIAAPGEEIPAMGYFDEVICTDGTSMAAAHVTGVASLLWNRDPKKDADFIRELINYSANSRGQKEQYGNGIIDAAYAQEIYDDFERQYESNASVISLAENSSELKTCSEEEIAASWRMEDHATVVKDAYAAKTKAEKDRLLTIKVAAKMPDKYRDACNLKGGFHGLDNYVKNYYHMMKFAKKYYSSGSKTAIAYLNSVNFNTSIKNGIDNLENKGGWNKLFNNQTLKDNKIKDTKESRGNILIGFAVHIAMDAYAHSAGKKVGANRVEEIGLYIRPEDKDEKGLKRGPYRDRKEVIKERWNCAKSVGTEIVRNWFQGSESGVALFKRSAHTEGSFYMRDLLYFVKSVKSDIENDSEEWFRKRSATTMVKAGMPLWYAWDRKD